MDEEDLFLHIERGYTQYTKKRNIYYLHRQQFGYSQLMYKKMGKLKDEDGGEGLNYCTSISLTAMRIAL